MNWAICAERDSNGTIAGFICTARDITNSKRIQNELKQNELFIRTALENLPLIFYMIDNSGIFKLSIGAGLTGLGLEQNQVVGISAFDIYKDFPEITSALTKTLTGERTTFETTISGSSYFTVCIPVSGWFDGIVAGGIAHDFNNLLGGIFGNIDMAAGETKENNVASYLAKALSAIDRARALTGQLLTFAKGGAPIKKLERLGVFIEETTKFALSGSNITSRFATPSNLWLCQLDKNQIGQVINNIVLNAQQAMPEGGTIEVTSENLQLIEKSSKNLLPAGCYVKIAIKDQGIGMPREILQKIFDPFFTTKVKGHGLGLATCFSIINRHGGCIEVESEPGKGSVFTVFLPASPEAIVFGSEKAIITHKGSGFILLMDDEEIIRDTIGSMLETMGYQVLAVSNSKEAIELFEKEHTSKNKQIISLILDLTIPGGPGGKETIREIRKIDNKIPAFVASGYAEDPVMSNPTEHGFTASICKPFRKTELSEMLNQFLQPNQ